MATKSKSKGKVPAAKPLPTWKRPSDKLTNSTKTFKANRWEYSQVVSQEVSEFDNDAAIIRWVSNETGMSESWVNQMIGADKLSEALVKGRHCTRLQLTRNVSSPTQLFQYVGAVKSTIGDKEALAKLGNDVKSGRVTAGNGKRGTGGAERKEGKGGRSKRTTKPQFSDDKFRKQQNEWVKKASNDQLVPLVILCITRMTTNVINGHRLTRNEHNDLNTSLGKLAEAMSASQGKGRNSRKSAARKPANSTK